MVNETKNNTQFLKPVQIYELANKIADMMESEGVTLSDLMADLPKIREEIYKERQATFSQHLSCK